MSVQPSDQDKVTQLLGEWRQGDASARDRVIDVVYDHVRELAARHLRKQFGAGAVTFQPTELANELFIKLLDGDATWEDRRHFYNAVAIAMRNILVDAARARSSDKRGGAQVHVTLSAAEEAAGQAHDAELLDDALSFLRGIDERKCEIIEMTYLLGLKREEIASALSLSVPTVDRELRFARAWLQQRLAA